MPYVQRQLQEAGVSNTILDLHCVKSGILDPSDNKAHHEGRQEGRDNETHGPNIQLNVHGLELGQGKSERSIEHTFRACRWNGNMSVTMYRP